MSFVFKILLLLLPWVVLAEPSAEILRHEVEELRSVVRSLRAENRQLEERNQTLVDDIVRLGRQIQALNRELEAFTGEDGEETEAAEQPEVVHDPLNPGARILYLNPHWHYLIVDIGSDHGLQSGQYGSVMRDSRRIALVKVTDVKPNQAVAEIELSSLEEDGIYPSRSDLIKF